MDLFEAIEKRRSVRRFEPDQVKKENLKKILEAGRLAPSRGNCQPWYFIVVTDPETKKALAIASNDQKFVAEANTVIVALGDSGVYPKRTASSTRILHKQDLMIAIEHMVLAATALGYGTCWIGAFSETEIKKILKIPENLTVVALLPVGVPAESPLPRPRKPFDEIFFRDYYGTPLRF